MPGRPPTAIAPGPGEAQGDEGRVHRADPVEQRIPDDVLRGFLSRFLPRYPGVRALSVEVDDGVVLLRGRADREDTLDEITDVVKRVEGVRLVLNQMGTDEEVMTAWEFAGRELAMMRTYLGRKWLVILLSAAVVAASAMLARLFSARAELLLSPFVGNVLLRSVLGSVISSLMVIGGFLLALGALGLTHVVLSILGLASIAGLAVGFAFRDITENFIASVLLGVRRPFQIGDYVTVAGHSGVVKSLNTRATVLVTLEGNHVRIPNATVFKEIMVNSTASPSSRHSFDVLDPARGVPQRRDRGHQQGPGRSAGDPPRAAASGAGRGPGAVRRAGPRLTSGRRPRASTGSSSAATSASGPRSASSSPAIGPVATAGPVAEGLSPKAPVDDRNGSTIRFDQASTHSRHDVASQAAANLRRDARAAHVRGLATRGRPGDAHGARARTARDARQR